MLKTTVALIVAVCAFIAAPLPFFIARLAFAIIAFGIVRADTL